MLRYMYVPKELDPVNFYEDAYNAGVAQIIHGPSSILDGILPELDNQCIIEIPQFRGLTIQSKVFEEGSPIIIHFVDEYLRKDGYESLDLELYKVDLDRPSVQTLLSTTKMKYDLEYSFFTELVVDSYGEYVIKIICNFKDGSTKEIFSDELIIYKKYVSNIMKEENEFKFEL